MKTLLSIVSTIFIFVNISKSQDAGLTLSYEDSTFISVILNGTSYDEAAPVMAFHNLHAGVHDLKVFKWLQKGSSIVKQPVYDGQVTLDAGRMTEIQINRFNQLVYKGSSITETGQNQKALKSQKTDVSEQYYQSRNEPAKLEEQSQPKVDGFTSPNTTPNQMSNENLAAHLELLKGMTNEKERLQTAKSLVSISTISSAQLAEMMKLFYIEQNRIRLADYGYDYVTDRQNFNVVYQTLSYPRSFRRLERRTR